MNIEWWMLDGIVCLILIVAIIRGAVKGIGDTMIRLLGLAAGFGICFMYLDKVTAWLASRPLRKTIYKHMYAIVRGYFLGGHEQAPGAGDSSEDIINNFVGNSQPDPYAEAMPKTLGGIVNDLADKTADVAATRLTDVCISILSVLLIIVSVWIVVTIIRLIYKHGKDSLILLRLSDRILGMAFGIVRGLILSFLAAAALIPVTTLISPLRVPDMIAALDQSYIAGTLYDINPVMLLVQHFLM